MSGFETSARIARYFASARLRCFVARNSDSQAQRQLRAAWSGAETVLAIGQKAVAGRLQDRIMFGCDFPVLRYEKVIADWKSKVTPTTKALFANAERYFAV